MARAAKAPEAGAAAPLSDQVVARVAQLMNGGNEDLHGGELDLLVGDVLARRSLFEAAAAGFDTPQYLVEEDALIRQAKRFLQAFDSPERTVRAHYAFKANPSACVVETLGRAGLSADCSSILELELALAHGFDRIVLSGPAKTDEELRLALLHHSRVTVHLDSFGELDRLERLAVDCDTQVQAGVRINIGAHGKWTKFGIPLSALPQFVDRAVKTPHVRLAGVQFHLSWQRHADGYVDTLAQVGKQMAARTPTQGWRFIDIGGGYYPEGDEAVYPWMTPRGRLLALLGLAPQEGPPDDWDGSYLLHHVAPIEETASRIVEACRIHLTPIEPMELWVEPGRYLVNQAVHLILRVADVKEGGIVITDGGTNLLGWERIEAEHCPLINITHPATTQQRYWIYGSLCTPHDLWGYSCYATEMVVGDVLVLPAQGSYVQTLAQRFIKPVCQTVVSDSTGELRRVQAEETFADRYASLVRPL